MDSLGSSFTSKTPEMQANDKLSSSSPAPPVVLSKGVEMAKKKLQAFCIQKKGPIAPVKVVKPQTAGSAPIVIGKLGKVKVASKTEVKPDEKNFEKFMPKPPKPGIVKKHMCESYKDLQKKNIAEIEEMKYKFELVELGIPLGLIYPTETVTSAKAMPTKSMPPIKSFIDRQTLDDIINEAKKARAEGRTFKFDYGKLLPDYENPFQRKKYEDEKSDFKEDIKKREDRDSKESISYKRREEKEKHRDKDKNKDKYRSHEKSKDKGNEKSSKHKEKETDKSKAEEISKQEKEYRKESIEENKKNSDDKPQTSEVKDTDVDLKDFLVCDSWSLDNDDKNSQSPLVDDRKNKTGKKTLGTLEQLKQNILNSKGSPQASEKNLKPGFDALGTVIDHNEDVLDIFAEEYLEKSHPKKSTADSVSLKSDNQDSKDGSEMSDDKFLESVIAEIKQETMTNEDDEEEKEMGEYDASPQIDESNTSVSRSSSRERSKSSQTDYSESSSKKSSESGYKSTDSKIHKSSKSRSSRKSRKRDSSDNDSSQTSSGMANSTDLWSFVLKICQPMLFRHDKNRCFKETSKSPKVWYTINPKYCRCVKDRSQVYEELDTCKADLVENLYEKERVQEASTSKQRAWYFPLAECLVEGKAVDMTSDWETEESQSDPTLNVEYQKFMESVWPAVEEDSTAVTTNPAPVAQPDVSKVTKLDVADTITKVDVPPVDKKRDSEGWSQESEVEAEPQKNKKKGKVKANKRKRSDSAVSDDSEPEAKKRKKRKKKESKKSKEKLKRRRVAKKKAKKAKKKKQIKVEDAMDSDDAELEVKKKHKKKKKKQVKTKKKKVKRKKAKAKSSSSESSSSSSSSELESELEKKSKKGKKKESATRKKKKSKKKRKKSSSESQENILDVNVLNNIKTEILTDDEIGPKKLTDQDFSPRRKEEAHREIINVKELQNDFVGNNSISVKEEIGDNEEETDIIVEVASNATEVQQPAKTIKPNLDEYSQCSSQESLSREKYEKDESHLRPSSQNSNYSFNDVSHREPSYNYELYEQQAIALQREVESSPVHTDTQRIQTVVRDRPRGEIKSDWRAGDKLEANAVRPSRWGLKPGEVNIVLTGGNEHYPEQPVAVKQKPVVYRIQSLANRDADSSATPMDYDEAYMEAYGAADKLAYGDCFAEGDADDHEDRDDTPQVSGHSRRSLDDRIAQVLASADASVKEEIDETSNPVKTRGVKRVSFADGYKPGQDSDAEEPPAKKSRSSLRRYGCPWPCPAQHPDHVPLWDALPPPPPPPGSPPPPHHPHPPLHLLRQMRPTAQELILPAQVVNKFDPSMLQVGGRMQAESVPAMMAYPQQPM